jgi:folate-binding protein YgfZ
MTGFPDPGEQVRVLREGVGVLAPPRAFVRVGGAGALAFLQNLLSQDLDGIAVGEARRALLLTPKARVIADPRVWRAAEELLVLEVEPVGAEPLVAALRRYRLGAKVEIELDASWALVSAIGPRAEAVELPAPVVDAALGELSRRDALVRAEAAEAAIAAAVEAGAVRVQAEAVEAMRVAAGEVRLGADVDERWMPAEVGLVEAAVSFDKGCFIGQEPVTRLHRRGHANRGPRRLALAAPVPVGTPITVGEREVGVITSVAGPPWLGGHRAIGVIRHDAEAPLSAAGVAVDPGT